MRIAELAGLSPRDLGRRTGYSSVHIWRVLAGRSPVTQNVATAIAAALGLPVDVVFPVRQECDRAAD